MKRATGAGQQPRVAGGGRRQNQNGVQQHAQLGSCSGDAAQQRAAVGRKHKKNPSSPPTTLDLHGVRVHFPFRPYECQTEYMKKVLEALLKSENALLESPTGTGKTLCLLCASIAWQQQQVRLIEEQKQQPLSQYQQLSQQPAAAGGPASSTKTHNKPPTIIYASRTHSQLSQVVRELKSTRYAPLQVVLGSREQMCVNPKVKKANSTASDINHDCNKLMKDRRCRYRNNLDHFQAPMDGKRPVAMDMEDLVSMGRESTVCPFYHTRSQVENAELILVPYNYIFDKDARSTTLAGVPWHNSVVIFDEAHNLEAFASESASFDLSNQDIAGCIHEVDRAINYLQMEGQGTSHGIKIDNLIRMKAIFLQLEDYLLNLPTNRTAYSGDFIMEVFERGAHITHGRYELFIDQIRLINDFLMDVRGIGGTSKGSPRLEHFATCLKRVFGHPLESKCLAKAGSYRVHVSVKTTDGAGRGGGQKVKNPKPTRTISYWCFAPSIAMEELRALKVRSIIVTSGTLSPLASYAMELGLPFPHTLENPHIIEKEQILVRVVGKGVSGKCLSSSYERRKDGEYYTELGNTLVSLAKVTPAGMLVFFPSYGVMNTCLERWGGPVSNRFSSQGQNQGSNNFFAPRRKRQSGGSNKYSFPHAPALFFDKNAPSTPWKRLTGVKSIVVEPKSSADLPDAISEFHRYLKLPRSTGCILMGVCRGKISEGIDFSHEQSRAVVITGLPFPPSHDPKVKMKREFLEDALKAGREKTSDKGGFDSSNNSSVVNKLSGNDWYTQQAHRAVNQAIGRVIRNNADYGAVLLLDARFGQCRNQEGLSKWLRPHIVEDTGVGATIRSLVLFYKDADALVEAKKKAQAKAVVELKYEDEPEESLTKFATIRPSSNGGDDKTTNDGSANVYVAPEQVIARGDLKDSEATSQHSQSNVLRQKPRPKLPPADFTPLFETKHPDTHVRRIQERLSSKADSPAQQFLRQAQECYSDSDLATIKKALVAMATAKKNRDLRGFTPPARKIVDIIVDDKNFALGTKVKTSGNMLLMFLQLLTSPFREEVENNVAFQVVFDKSAFGAACKEKLSDRHLGLARSYMIELLHSLWCSETEDGKKMEDFLRKTQEIFRCFVKNSVHFPSSLLNAFVELVPARYGARAKALLDEMAASLKVERLRKLDRATNEASLKAENIASSVANLETRRPRLDQSVSKEGTMKNASCRKRPAIDQPAAALAVASAKARKAIPSLSSLIENMETDTYVQTSPGDLVEKLKRNAPTDIDCPVCSSTSKEPLVAECGHVACLGCWKAWFVRSKTCPTCRAAASFDSLARVVYESGLGGGDRSGLTPNERAATVSAAGALKSDDTHEEEDELEITQG